MRDKNTPITRTTLRGLERNAAVAIGNRACASDRAVLVTARHDDQPTVRQHAHWAPGIVGAYPPPADNSGE